MYGCESWTIEKAEHRRIDAFELWCWGRLLRVPWTARRSTVNPKGNQSWIFIGRTDAEAETPILWPPDAKNWKRPWCWERLKAGGEEDDRRLDGWMVSPTQWTWVWASSGRWWRTGKPAVLQSMGLQTVRHDRANEQEQPRCQAIWEGSVTVKSLTVEFWFDTLGAFRKGMVDRANREELKSD